MISARIVTLLFAVCSTFANAQASVGPPPDWDLAHAWPAWLLGDHAAALRHFRSAAERGHPIGQYNLAMMLLHGEGTPARPSQALGWLRKSAQGGFAPAQLELARRYEEGRGVRRDPQQALHWYARAAAGGDASAARRAAPLASRIGRT